MTAVVTVEDIDPDTALKMLKRNTSNRNMKRTKIAQYARDMAAGRWMLNGEAIKFDKNGVLLDGQNRLYACIASGVTFTTMVVRGLAPETQQSMDGGCTRTAADNLTLREVKNATIVAAGIRCALAARDVGYAYLGKNVVSSGEVAEFLEENPDFRDAATLARRVHKFIDCPPGLTAFAAWVLGRIDEKEAESFFTDAAEKIGLDRGDPVLALTRKFAEARRDRKILRPEERLSCIYRAWNYRRDGLPLTVMRVNSPGVKGGIIEVPEPR